jgi:hypothetical protein
MIIYAMILLPRNLIGTSLIIITLLYGVASMDLHQEMVKLRSHYSAVKWSSYLHIVTSG